MYQPTFLCLEGLPQGFATQGVEENETGNVPEGVACDGKVEEQLGA